MIERFYGIGDYITYYILSILFTYSNELFFWKFKRQFSQVKP